MRVLPVLVYTGRSRKGEPESSGSAERGGRCCRCTGSIRCTEGKQYGGNKRGNRAGRSSCLHLPELRRRDCDRCDDGSDILFLLPQPGGAFRPAFGRIYAGFCAAVQNKQGAGNREIFVIYPEETLYSEGLFRKESGTEDDRCLFPVLDLRRRL